MKKKNLKKSFYLRLYWMTHSEKNIILEHNFFPPKTISDTVKLPQNLIRGIKMESP